VGIKRWFAGCEFIICHNHQVMADHFCGKQTSFLRFIFVFIFHSCVHFERYSSINSCVSVNLSLSLVGRKHRMTSPRQQHRALQGSSAKYSPSSARLHAKRNAGLVVSPSTSRQPIVTQASSRLSPQSSCQQPGSPRVARPVVTMSPNSQRLAVNIETHQENASSSSDSA